MHRLNQIVILLVIVTLSHSCDNSSSEHNMDEMDETIIETINSIVPIDGDEQTALIIPEEELINENQDDIPQDLDPLNICIDSIWACQKVIDKNNEVIELSGGDRELTIVIDERPTEVYLKLAEDNGMNYVTYWTFIVEPLNDYSISFYDVLEDENIDFKEWSQKK